MERSRLDCSYGMARSLFDLSYRREISSIDHSEGKASGRDYLHGVERYIPKYSYRI